MERLKEVLSIQSESYDQWRMFAYIVRRVKAIPNTTIYTHNGNIYVTKGDAITYPCMVSHMDTVHDIVEDLHPIEFDGLITGFNRVRMEQTGIGGDDKVGVYITLEMLERFDVMKVAFFRDEEVGCNGSYVADMTFFEDCRFVLQCDRKGNDDFVTVASGVDLSSCDFQEAVKPIISRHGYKFAQGMMTDVMALKQNGIKCSVANMSCGYYRPHMADEYVNVWDVEDCLQMCMTIISQCTAVYSHKYRYKAPSYTKAPPAPNGKYAVKTLWDDDYVEVKQAKKIEDDYYFGWDDWDWDKDVPKEPYGSVCQDCWGDVIHDEKTKLCKSCHSWYKKANYI